MLRLPLLAVHVELAVAIKLLAHGALARSLSVGVAWVSDRRQTELHWRLVVGLRHASRFISRRLLPEQSVVQVLVIVL